MSILDWIIVGLYLTYITYTGVSASRGAKSLDDFLLAGRSLPWWAVGLSVMATQMSAITLIGTTGKAYEDGLRFIQFYFGLPLAMLILCVTAVPFFRRAKVYTAYEYLERRFDAKTRTLTSACFLISRGLSCGVIIAAPSIVLSSLLSWNELWIIAAMGITAVIYSMFGGVRAVTWADVRQMAVVLVGLFTCAFVLYLKLPQQVGISGAVHLASVSGRLEAVDTRFSLKETYTLWSGLIGGLFLMLSYFGCDQSQVQRYLAAKTEAESRRSLLLNAVLKIPLQLIILFLGVLVFIFYQFEKPPLIFHSQYEDALKHGEFREEYSLLDAEFDSSWNARRELAITLLNEKGKNRLLAEQEYTRLSKRHSEIRQKALAVVSRQQKLPDYSDVNYIFPRFFLTQLPIGLVGLMVAAVFAAAMSSISSELNALAASSVIDIYRRHLKPEESDAHYLRASRLATLFWGVFTCVVAFYAGKLGALIEVVNQFGSYFYGSLLGVFVLAICFKHVSSSGAFWGLILGVLSVAVIDMAPNLEISFLWYNVVGTLVVVVSALVISFCVSYLGFDK